MCATHTYIWKCRARARRMSCRNAQFYQVERQKVTAPMTDNDEDLIPMSREQLVAEVKKLRAGIRTHRDSTGHDLCWHHPALWSLLPEPITTDIAVPPWPEFLRGCIRYRASLSQRALQAGPSPPR
jgi:hypothetical protein